MSAGVVPECSTNHEDRCEVGAGDRFHQPTRRTAEGPSKKDIIRCLKRFVAREVYQRVMIDHRARLGA